MYTLIVEFASNELMKAAQAIIQENKKYSYEFQLGTTNRVTIGTSNIKELKRLVDIIESEDFMK